MGCRSSQFKIGKWKHFVVDGHKVDVAPASYRNGVSEPGAVWKLDGKFQGFTGSVKAALSWVQHDLHEAACPGSTFRADRAGWVCSKCGLLPEAGL